MASWLNNKYMKWHVSKMTSWKNGKLHTSVYAFESFEEAKGFAESLAGNAVKIYTEEGELVHTVSDSVQTDSYA